MASVASPDSTPTMSVRPATCTRAHRRPAQRLARGPTRFRYRSHRLFLSTPAPRFIAPNNPAGGNRYDSATDRWIRPDGTSYRTSVNLGPTVFLPDDAPTPVKPYEPIWDGHSGLSPFPSTYQSPHVPNSNDLFMAVANDFGRYRNSFQLAQNAATVVAWGAVGGIYAPVVGGIQMTPLTRYLIYKGIEIFADQYLPSDRFPPEAPQNPPAIEHPIGPFNPPGAGPNP